MANLITKALKTTPVYYPVRNWVHKRKHAKRLVRWERGGRPSPPPHAVKQQVLRDHADAHGLRILVETGTFHGDMVEAMKTHFDIVYSIELSEPLYRDAKRRFKSDSNVILVNGDSGIELKTIVAALDQPALFWLDGHYSGGETAQSDLGNPIFSELGHILQSPIKGHVIIIDDARLFDLDPGYPSLQAVIDCARSHRSDLDVEVAHDSIRFSPGRVGEQ